MRRTLAAFAFGLNLMLVTAGAHAEAPAQAVAAFQSYVGTVEARLAQEHRSRDTFFAGEAGTEEGRAQLRQGEVVIEPVKTPEVRGAMLHDWRGSAFVPGANAAAFEKLLRDFDAYPQVFAPQVTRAHTTTSENDRVQGTMRVRQKHVITVVMDTTYDGRFGQLDPQDQWSASRSTRVEEIADAGTNRERALGPQEEHGFLWRINTYWSWQEQENGLYIQVESVSLTRGIPTGLGWMVRPFVESVPRESLEFTLTAARKAMSGQESVAGEGKPGTASDGGER